MKPIVYVEYNESWLFDGEKFTPCSINEIKRYQAGTCVPLSSLHTGNFKFLSSLGETERQIQTEIKMHEEGGLDSEKEYEVTSYNHALEFENSSLVEAFACAHEKLDEYFGSLVKKTKVLDWIVPSFITYESYYTSEDSEAKTDLFFYLSDTASYAVLFHKGKYIAHRRTSSIELLAKEIGTDSVRCRYMLSNYGLAEEKYPLEEKPFFEQLQLLFSKEVEKIIHTINHKRGLFGINRIDRIFVDFNGNALEGLENIYAAYGMENIPSEPFVCQNDKSVNSHRFAKAMYIYLCANGQIQNPLNLSPYERQAIWYKRHSGRLISVAAAALVLGLVHPLYYYMQDVGLEEKISLLEGKLHQMQEQSNLLSQKLKAIQLEASKDEEKLELIQNTNKVYEMTLQSLPLLMHSRDIRQKMMYDAVNILERYNLSALSLEQNGTNGMSIHVIAEYTQRAAIAKFMQRWMETGYKEARTDEIYLDQNIYESKIEVLR